MTGSVILSTRSQRIIDSTNQLINAGKFEEAIESCNKIESNFPDLTSQAKLLKQNSYLNWGKKDLADKDFLNAKNHLIEAMNGSELSDSQEARLHLYDLSTGWVQSRIDAEKFEEAIHVVDDLTSSEVTKQSDRSAEYLMCKIPEIYILWGDSLVYEKKFSSAVDVYKKGEQINEDCPVIINQLSTKRKNAYISYAEELISDKKFEDSVSFLQKSDFSDNIDVREVIAKSIDGLVSSTVAEKKYTEARDYLITIKKDNQYIYNELDFSIEKVNGMLLDDLIAGGDLMEAYKTVNDLLSGPLDENEKNSITDKKTQIMQQLARDIGGDGKGVMQILSDIACSGKPAKENELSTIIAAKGEKRKAVMCNSAFSMSYQFEAAKPAELKYAVWGRQSTRTMAACSYEDGYSLTPEITSYDIKVYDVLTGKVIATTTIAGAYPYCPSSYRFQIGDFDETLSGNPPTQDQVNNYLKTVIR